MAAIFASFIGALAAPTGTVHAATTPALDHVFVIVMENHSYNEIIGSSSTPYITSLLPQAAVATNYTAVAHPSLPNYLALVGGSTFGITSDCTTCWVSATNLADQLESAGRSWKAYEESMPSPCFVGDSNSYAQKHDPFVYFNDIRNNTARCQSHVVPFTQLASDLKGSATTPSYAFITPNLCNDMHDCSVSTGDTWLKQQVPAILSSPAFTAQRSLLAITWDEDDGSSTNRVATLFLGSGAAAGARSSTAYNHYSLLRTVESTLGAQTAGPGDTGATPMTDLLVASNSCAASVSAPGTATTTLYPIQMSASGCTAASFEVSERDVTLNGSWYVLPAGSATQQMDGFAGHSYQYMGRVQPTAGAMGAWSSAISVQVSSTASQGLPWRGLYTLDAYGGVHPASSPPPAFGQMWSWNAARSARPAPGALGPQAGLVLDAYGALHPYGAPITVQGTPYWPGWDIARDFAFMPDGSGGYVLDGYGGLHAFSVNGAAPPPAAQGGPYFSGHDIARKVVIFSDATGGYVLDGYGGIHPFGIGRPAPAAPGTTGYWPGWDIAHDFVLVPGTRSGYVLDGYGALHPFAPTGQSLPAVPAGTPYWSGWDIARGLWLLPGASAAGYVADGWGGLHQFGGAPPVVESGYTPRSDVTRAVFGA